MIAIVVTLFALPAFAQSPPPAGGLGLTGVDKPTPESVVKLVQEILPRVQYERSLKLLSDQLAQMMAARTPNVSAPDLTQALTRLMPYDWLIGVTAGIYWKRFNTRELEDIAAFYRTPTGKKLAEQLPDIMGDSNLILQKRLQEKLPALMEELMKKKSSGPSKL
jgi:hypothetical protein